MKDFGLTFNGQDDVPAAKTSTAFFPLSETSIELVHPLNGEGPIQGYLDKKGVLYGNETVAIFTIHYLN